MLHALSGAPADGGQVETGRTFYSRSGGKWAGEQLIRALQRNEPITPALLRTNAVLRKDEWKVVDNAVVEEGIVRYRGVADLMAAGLTQPIANAMGKTVFEWENVGDMNPAIVSMDGMVRSENDRPDYLSAGIPLPITHKDFFFNARVLAASRNRGEGLDVTSARVAGRKCSEELERMLFLGGKQFGGLPIYGYSTHPNRNTMVFGAGGAWSGTATGEQILTDVLAAMAIAEADRFWGPYVLYVSRNISLRLNNDFKAGSDKSIRSRLLEVDGLTDIRVADMLTGPAALLIQMTSDVVTLLIGENLQTVQWDIEGAFGINMKAFQIIVPLIRADQAGRSGIVHIA